MYNTKEKVYLCTIYHFTMHHLRTLRVNHGLDGITLSGGDPFYNPDALLELLVMLKRGTQQNIWCYTGFTYEALLAHPTTRDCLRYIDTLVDGPFVQRLYDPSLPFRGSSNQRILHLHPDAVTISSEGGYRP